jgi:hypothetical protein
MPNAECRRRGAERFLAIGFGIESSSFGFGIWHPAFGIDPERGER